LKLGKGKGKGGRGYLLINANLNWFNNYAKSYKEEMD